MYPTNPKNLHLGECAFFNTAAQKRNIDTYFEVLLALNLFPKNDKVIFSSDNAIYIVPYIPFKSKVISQVNIYFIPPLS